MNWIEIDKILYCMIERHNTVEDVYKEAEKQFKWDRSQSRAAVDPLIKRHSKQLSVIDAPPKKTRVSKKSKQ
jgi:predicted transcriptional regulator YdeE